MTSQPEQESLFAEGPEVLPLQDGMLKLWPHWLSATDADAIMPRLKDDTPWQQQSIKMYGKTLAVPRLTAWYGDPASTYTWSGIRNTPLPWTPLLMALKTRIEAVSGGRFNSVLLNLYRDGNDSVAWHSDDEPELGDSPVIASLSLGSERSFQLKRKNESSAPIRIALPHGSLLLMSGATQAHWSHRIPKSTAATGPRINLTFRRVY